MDPFIKKPVDREIIEGSITTSFAKWIGQHSVYSQGDLATGLTQDTTSMKSIVLEHHRFILGLIVENI